MPPTPNLSNEISQTPSETPASPRIVPRRIVLALLLGLFLGPFAQIYCGRMRRAISLYLFGLLLFCSCMLFCLYLPWGLPSILTLAILICCWRIIYIPLDAALIAYQSKGIPLKSYQRFWVYGLILVVAIVLNALVQLGFQKGLVEAFYIPTGSMNRTLLPGDRIFVDKMWYRFAPPQRGDIVAFFSNAPIPEIFAHRIIGLPGDIIEIRNEKLYVNGQLQEEAYAEYEGEIFPDDLLKRLIDFGPETIPEGHFFHMGDNRRRSKDSRLTGCVPLQNIIGKVQIVFWSSSLDKINTLAQDNISSAQTEKQSNRIRWERIGIRFDLK